nr:hypothetical protein OG781_17835 [Streptomyces sp. NBC_00830]
MQNTVQTPVKPSAAPSACGARRPGWDQGPAIGSHRIPCTLPAGHEGEHRDGLGNTWAPGSVEDRNITQLLGIPAQPTATQAADAIEQPRTWSFISRQTSELLSVTCMPGCEMDHGSDIEAPTNPDDIWCQSSPRDVTLPVNESGHPEDVRVLSTTLNVRPFDAKLSQRLPHAAVELMQDCWIEDLDPEAFEQVIDTLAERVATMREAHAELVRIRAAYRGQQLAEQAGR